MLSTSKEFLKWSVPLVSPLWKAICKFCHRIQATAKQKARGRGVTCTGTEPPKLSWQPVSPASVRYYQSPSAGAVRYREAGTGGR